MGIRQIAAGQADNLQLDQKPVAEARDCMGMENIEVSEVASEESD